MKILFVIAEAFPLAKVGGLADIGSALPKELAWRGHDVTLVIPRYGWIDAGEKIGSATVLLGDARVAEVAFERLNKRAGLTVVGVRCEAYFDRSEVYGYLDDIERFAVFSRAAFAFAAQEYNPPDVIHAHDWHTGLVCHEMRAPDVAGLWRTATVFTIHNLGYTGAVSDGMRSDLGLNDLPHETLLGTGILDADVVSTVSDGYLAEIVTPEFGFGLDSLLRSRSARLHAIRNGIEHEIFDPRTDPNLVAQYDPTDLSGRTVNKLELLRRSELPDDPERPLVGMVSRLVNQKGIDLVLGALDDLVGLGVRVAVMGVGDQKYADTLEEACRRHRDAVAYHATRAEPLARLFYGACDLLLAPSEYEPCALAPLVALRYGCLPVVRRTGGMRDTIPDYFRDPRTGLGFTFTARTPQHLVGAVRSALRVYRDPPAWRALQRRAMEADYGWRSNIDQYEDIYAEAVAARRSARGVVAQ